MRGKGNERRGESEGGRGRGNKRRGDTVEGEGEDKEGEEKVKCSAEDEGCYSD